MQTTPGEARAEEDIARFLSTTPPTSPASAIDFRIIADKSLSLIVVADHTGAIQYVNPTFCESTGFSAVEVIGHKIHDLGELDSGTLRELWDSLGFGLPWRGEFLASTKNGRRFWVHASISPITDGAGRVTHFIAVGLDITDRRGAEEALRESEERFRKLAETTTAATLIFEGARIRYANNAASDITGYSSEELLAKNFWEVAQPDIDSDIAEWLQTRALGEPVPPRAEVRIITKPGEVRWLDFNTGFVELDGREYVLGTAFDITARKLAEEALRDSEEKFRTLVDTTPAATVIFQGARVRYANRMVFDVLGYSAEDLATLNFWDAVHPDYRDLVRERGNARLRGEDVPSSYEVRFLTKSGEPRWGIYSAALITYEGEPAVIGTIYDITERKQAEEARHQSEERYRILYQDNPSMYFTLAEDLSVLSVNQHGAEQLGYTPEDLVGEPVMLVVHADDQTDVRRQLESLLRHRGARHGLEFRKVRKDGEVIWVKESVRVTHDVDGSRIILVVCEDISERKRMEDALQGLREDLEHKAERAVAGDNPCNLSFREITVLHLVTGGRSDKEIGVVLGIRPQTVSKHVANVLKKMQASSRTEAGVRALREGLVA